MIKYWTLLLISSASICSYSISEPVDHFSAQAHARLMETAEQLRLNGNFSEAEIVFTQLFNSVRANNGLFHEQQLAVLDRLIAVNLANGDWPRLKQHIDYYDWLLNRLYADTPLQLAEHLQINASHHELAARETVGPARNWHLVQTRQQLWRAVSALESLPGENSELPLLLHRIALHHYTLSRLHDLRWLTSFETRSDEPAMISGWAMQGSDISKRSYDIGAELISRIIDHYQRHPDTSQTTQAAIMAELMVHRGDWDMLFGREKTALIFYNRSLEFADTSSCKNKMIEGFFENVIELPVTTLEAGNNICTSPVTTRMPAADAPDHQSGIYRPQRHKNEWLLTPSPASLNALNTGSHHE